MEFKTTHLMNFSNLLSRKFDSQRISSTVAVWLTVMLTVLMSTNLWAQAAPSVTTDKADYAPGESMVINGFSFGSTEDLRLRILDLDRNTIVYEKVIKADENGDFVFNWTNPPLLDPADVLYHAAVEVLGLSSETLIVSNFTDGVDTRITSITPSTGIIGSTISASAKWEFLSNKKDNIWLPYNGITLIFTLGSSNGSATTDTNGIANISLLVPSAATQLSVTFNPPNNGAYNYSDAFINFTAIGCIQPNNVSNGFTGSTICSGSTGTLTFDANNTGFVSSYTIVYTDGTTQWSQQIATADATTFNVAVNPTATTTYTLVSITNGAGCVRTTEFGDTTARVTVNQLPNAPTAGNVNTTYDGTLKTGTATVPTGITVDWFDDVTGGNATVAPSGTNAGTYTAWAEARNTTTGCKSATRTQVTVTIGQAVAVITVTPYSVTYDGNAHTSAFTAVGVESPTPVDLTGLMTVSGTTHTNAGTYNADAWSFAGNTNYAPTSGTVNNAIGKALTTTVVTVSQPLIYNGNPQGGSALVTGAGGLNQALTVTYEGTGLTTYASSSTAPTNAGTYNIAATYAESANHFGSSDNKNFTIGTAIASVTANNKSKPYGEDNPELDATVVGQIVGGDVINYSLSTTATQTSNIGTYPITVTLGSNPNYIVSAYDGTLTVTQASTTTSLILSAESVRYMDMITMTAIITPLNTATPLTGSVEFKIGSTVYGTAVAVPIPDATDGSVQATLIKQVAEMPASYIVTATFSSTNANYLGSQNTKPLTVVARTASPYTATGFYTGDLFAWTTGPSTSTATLTMTAAIKDANSPTGDVRGARVTFYFVNGTTLTPIPSAQNLPVGLVDVNDGSVGTASAIVQLNIGSANAASFQIAVGITGAYTNTPGATLSQTIVTVSKPVTGGYITGGGEVANSTTSSGYIKGHSTLNTGYQFDIQYTKSGTNPKGKAQIFVRSYYTKEGILDSKLHTYIITTNAIALLNVGTPLATGTFSAKANLVEQLEDLTTIAIEGGSTFQMVVFQSGCEQQIAITLYRKAGGIWFSSNWNATSAKTGLKAVTTSSKVYVAGGGPCLGSSSSRTGSSEVENIQVISSTPEIQSITSEELETEAVLFKVLAYPNPSTEYFTLRLQGATQEPVQVNVFDVSGRQVFSKTGNYNDTYQFGGHFQAGVYLVRVQQGTSVENLKVIKR